MERIAVILVVPEIQAVLMSELNQLRTLQTHLHEMQGRAHAVISSMPTA
jgi:hypothetical protein